LKIHFLVLKLLKSLSLQHLLFVEFIMSSRHYVISHSIYGWNVC